MSNVSSRRHSLAPSTISAISETLLADPDDLIDTHITLTWLDIKYSIKGKPPSIWKRLRKPATYRQWKESEGEEFLHGILGEVRPGQLVGIMGGSGAGKTTMLNVLAGKLNKGEPSGIVLVNGQERDPKVWPFLLSYVEQKDILDEELTVRELIQFAVDMHCRTQFDRDNRESKTQKFIKAVGLEKVADRKVGDSQKGISGGERKRLSIALELAAERNLLFLDEPTSGLDAGTAFDLLECLSGLVRKHHLSTILSIHQPSEELLRKLDLIILMSLGKLVYFGSLQEIIDHFESLGFECPHDENPADWILDLVSIDLGIQEGDMTREEQKLMSTQRIARIQQAWEEIQEETLQKIRQKRFSMSVASRRASVSSTTSHHWRRHSTSSMITAAGTGSASASSSRPSSTRRSVASIFLPEKRLKDRSALASYPLSPPEEFRILFKRYFRVVIRSTSANLLLVGEFLLLSLLLGFIFFQLTRENFGGVQSRIGLLATVPDVTIILISIELMVQFCKQREVIIRERFSKLYRLIDAYTANVLAILPIRLAAVAVYATIIYYLTGLRTDSFTYYLIYMGIIMLITLYACFFGIFVAAISTGSTMAAVIRALCLNTFILFAGNLARSSDVTPIISWMRFLSPNFYVLQSLLQNELIDLEIAGEQGQFYLDLYDLNQFSIMWSAGALMIWCGAMLIFGFLGLYFSTKPKYKLIKDKPAS